MLSGGGLFGGKSKKKDKAKAADADDAGESGLAETKVDGAPGDVEMSQIEDGKAAIGNMRNGDYMIHILLEKAKDLKCPKDSTVDPMLEVTSLGQKQFSSAKDDIGGTSEITYGEHIFLEAPNVDKKAAEEGKIKLRLLDKGLFKNSMIGEFDFDVSAIYFKQDHALLHKWIALSDPYGENYNEITGYLKVSISVTCTGDEAIQIEEDNGEVEDQEILMPPSLNPEFYQIKIRFFTAQELPIMDNAMLGLRKAKTDAFLQTAYKGKKMKTRVVVYEKDDIAWNQEIWLPAQYPVIEPRIVVGLMDQDEVGSETIGSLLFDAEEIIGGALEGKIRWVNIYGSPMGQADTAAKREMNENPEIASNWKGRVLLQVTCHKTDKPVAKVCSIDPELVKEAQERLIPQDYTILAEVGQGICLPEKRKYKVKLIVGGKQFCTDEAKVQNNNYNRWNQRFQYDKPFQLPYTARRGLDQVIILLMHGDQPVAYYKEHIKKFRKAEAQWHWIQLIPDPTVGKVTNPHKAGIISFKLSVSKPNQEIDPKQYKAWKKQPPPRAQSVSIRAYIYQARDLPASDENGTSDPYIKAWDLSGKKKQTEVIEDNCNPLYYQTLELEYEVRDIKDPESYPPILMDVYDADNEIFDSTDDFLGRAQIEPEDLGKMINDKWVGESLVIQSEFERDKAKEIPSVPKWHNLYFQEGEQPCGQILCSFAVSNIDHNFTPSQPSQVNLRARVPFEEFDINMLILGMRSLQSPGILPVKKAYIEFKYSGLVPPDSISLPNIKTQPGPVGDNPTINTTMKVSVPLPTDPLYCPRLTCFVYDNISLGFSQPQIGVFTLPIGDLMIALQGERREELAALQDVVDELHKILSDPNGISSLPASYNADIPVIQKNASGALNDSPNEESKDDGDQISERRLLQPDAGKKDKSGSAEMQTFGSVTEKVKKKMNKGLKGSQLGKDKDLRENLGANEQAGIHDSHEKMNSQIQEIMERRKKLSHRNIAEPESNAQKRVSQLIKQKTKKADLDVPEDVNTEIRRYQTMSKKEQIKLMEQDSDMLKRIQEDERNQAEEEAYRAGQDATAYILEPEYGKDPRLKIDREIKVPSEHLYIGLGWDEDRTTKRRHYRKFYTDELENIKEIFPTPSPFNTFQIKRGQSRGLSQGFFSNMFKKTKKTADGALSDEKVVGAFKGIIEVESKDDRDKYQFEKQKLLNELGNSINEIAKKKTNQSMDLELADLCTAEERNKFKLQMRTLNLAHLDILTHVANIQSEDILKRQLLESTKCVVRLYVIEAFNLSSRDNGSASDPYLYLRCNNKTVNERDKYQLDEPNPKFYKKYDFEGTFPGCSPLEIAVWDYDDIFGDDLIGKTSIDLEDRYFSLGWQSLEHKPVEYRQLYHESSMAEQGVVKLWAEINPINVVPDARPKLWDIRPKPPSNFEVRICVFNCEGVEMMDWEGTCDAFCRGFFDSKEDVQETDTHYRNQDGKPDFQYRLVYNIMNDRKDYKYTLQMYDRDFFKSNDMIGEVQINLRQLIEDCALVKKPLQLNKGYYTDVIQAAGPYQVLTFDKENDSRFWVEMKAKDPKTRALAVRGKVKMQIDVLPLEQAKKNPVGKARDNPNHSPTLPQPEGRIQLTLNPFKMFNQLVGPEMRAKICRYLAYISCCALCLAILPAVIGQIISNGFLSLIGLN